MGNVESRESEDHPEPEGTALEQREAGHRPRDFLSEWQLVLCPRSQGNTTFLI